MNEQQFNEVLKRLDKVGEVAHGAGSHLWAEMVRGQVIVGISDLIGLVLLIGALIACWVARQRYVAKLGQFDGDDRVISAVIAWTITLFLGIGILTYTQSTLVNLLAPEAVVAHKVLTAGK